MFGSLDLCAILAQGRCLHGLSTISKLEDPHPRRKPHSSGMAAAAGVVNQADAQRILLPGYFTTPGLHHTHPLQASLVGPQNPGPRGQGGLGQLTVKDGVFSRP